MYVIGNTSDTIAIAFGSSGNRRKIGMHRPYSIIGEERNTVFCGEDDVEEDV